MASRGKRDRVLGSAAAHAALTLTGALFMLPFVWLVLTSLKPATQIFEFPPRWIPRPFCWENYAEVFRTIPLWQYTRNTLFVALSGTAGTLLSCSLAAYGFAMVRWRMRTFFFLLMLSTMMLPPQVTMIPVFMIFKSLGWVGTFRPLVVPSFFASAFFVFLLRQFFLSIPAALVDAAKIDGCSHLGVYWRIALPLSKPALAVVAFFSFTAYWNDFMSPLIYLNDDLKYTLSLGLQQFIGQHSAKWDLLMAASTLMTAPIVLLFFVLQRTFVEGITLTGIKG